MPCRSAVFWSSHRCRVSATVLAASALLALVTPGWAATSGANGTHDPSRVVESGGKLYFCSTGGACASSTDGLRWASAGALHISIPSWSTTYMSGNQGVWAPDLIFYKDRYLIYYSFCGLPAANAPCAIGLLSTPTLDASSSSFKLVDAGKVVNNPTNDATYQFSTIDPAPIIDTSGNLWLVWGSGFGKDQNKTQIWITRLDNATGLPLAIDSAYQPPTVLGYPLKTGRREGAYMHYHAGYYYLFWNEGSCCSGTSSTYTIWVSRSTSITGPFTGDKVFFASTGNIHGPGHIGIYSACGVERFTYHYYPTDASILGENALSWGSDGWPVVGSEATTPIVPCGSGGSGGAGGASGSGGSGGAKGSGGASGTGGASGSGGAAGNDGGTSDAAGSGGGAGGGGLAGSGGTGSGGRGSIGSGGTGGGGGERTDGGPGGAGDAGCSCQLGAGEPCAVSLTLLLLAAMTRSAIRKARRGRNAPGTSSRRSGYPESLRQHS